MDGASLPLGPFEFFGEPRAVFGAGASAGLGELVAEVARGAGLGREQARVLVVSDAGVVAAGHAERGMESIARAGMRCALFREVAANPTTRHVAAAVEFARSHGANVLVGFGGGSAMDCAKGANFILTNGGRMQDYWGVGKATRPMLPFVAVPTTAGTGSEAQSFALIADDETHQKMACGDRKALARLAVLDPDLTRTQPRAVAMATGLDAMAHAIESYVCARANAASCMFAGAAWRLLRESFGAVLNGPGDSGDAAADGARASMLLGAHFAGRAIEHSMLGAAHAAANPLTARFGLTHGIAVAVMLPHVVRYNAGGPAASRYAELEPGGAEALAALLEGYLEAAGVPRRLGDHGIDPAAAPLLARDASRQWTAGFNPVPIDEHGFARLYRDAFGGT